MVILYNNGGIYLDIDVELIKPIDNLLIHSCFAGYEGSSAKESYVATGLIFGAEKKNILVKNLLNDYKGMSFYKPNGELNLLACTFLTTSTIERVYRVKLDGKYIQFGDGTTLYPSEYFCPKNYETGKMRITDETYSIHHYGSSWFTRKQKFILLLKRIAGKRVMHVYYVFKTNGIIGTIKKLF